MTGERVTASASSSDDAFSASVTVLGDGTKEFRHAAANASLTGSFELTPLTLMYVLGSYTLDLSRNMWETGDIEARVSMELRSDMLTAYETEHSSKVHDSLLMYPWAEDSLQATKTRSFGLSFINGQNRAVDGAFNMSVNARAGVVPEANGPLLALFGMAALAAGAALKRRALP